MDRELIPHHQSRTTEVGVSVQPETWRPRSATRGFRVKPPGTIPLPILMQAVVKTYAQSGERGLKVPVINLLP
jgi:hypothetical protein